MSYPDDLKYTKDHEWVRVEGKIATVGITHFAQSELGDVVFVDLPSVGRVVKQGETLSVVESTKAASDIYAPLAGKVKEVNSELPSGPDKVNTDPYVSGWMVKLEDIDESEIANLMNADQYKSMIGA